VSSDGQTGQDPLVLAGECPHFSLSKLACYLAQPALIGEFFPDCPWIGVSRLRSPLCWENRYTDPSVLADVLRESIATCIDNASTVAVALSGGLDSLAVLWHTQAICERDGRHLVAVTADLQDDTGQSSLISARHLIEALQINCELISVGGIADRDAFPEPVWHPAGPRNDAMPRLNRAMADRASRYGAEVLLSGNGADELLGTVRYLLLSFLHAGRWSAARSYLRDLRDGGPRRYATEGLSLLAALLPTRFSLPLYWATNWPELCTFQAPVILSERFRPYVEDWTRQWIRTHIELHVRQCHSWAVADAWDALFPSDPIPPAGNIPERDPFLTAPFVQAALSIHLPDRYASHFPTHYQRRKALVMQLYPQSAHTLLPRSKQIFSQAFATYHSSPHSLERCLTYGLVDARQLATCHDPSLLRCLESIERWICGAEERGAHASEE
jgi:asparagine synthetase B (glutamine-hydrolysing)